MSPEHWPPNPDNFSMVTQISSNSNSIKIHDFFYNYTIFCFTVLKVLGTFTIEFTGDIYYQLYWGSFTIKIITFSENILSTNVNPIHFFRQSSTSLMVHYGQDQHSLFSNNWPLRAHSTANQTRNLEHNASI